VVANEGLGGTRSFDGADRLDSTKDRFPKAEYWLILFGTNDAGATLFTPSGANCTEAHFQAGEPSCQGTYKEYMRNMVLNLKYDDEVPMLAKVPFSSTATAEVDQRIQEYNTVIDQLVQEHSIQVSPPDFYTYFQNNTSELADGTHPNGQGYISMAYRWFEALEQGIFLCQYQLMQTYGGAEVVVEKTEIINDHMVVQSNLSLADGTGEVESLVIDFFEYLKTGDTEGIISSLADPILSNHRRILRNPDYQYQLMQTYGGAEVVVEKTEIINDHMVRTFVKIINGDGSVSKVSFLIEKINDRWKIADEININ
jgi:lysophospholipase L1-like esterase